MAKNPLNKRKRRAAPKSGVVAKKKGRAGAGAARAKPRRGATKLGRRATDSRLAAAPKARRKRSSPRAATGKTTSRSDGTLTTGIAVALGAAAVATVYGIHQGNQADQAWAHAARQEIEANLARQAAASHAARAAHHRNHAAVANARSRKLAADLAHQVNKQIAEKMKTDSPPLRFDGCTAASTNGIDICVDMQWLLSGIVDAATEHGDVWGRVVGVVAHEWFHFLDTQRGSRASHEEEFAADRFAGKMLAILRVPPQHFAELLRTFPQSSSHPAGAQRAEAMLERHEKQIRC